MLIRRHFRITAEIWTYVRGCCDENEFDLRLNLLDSREAFKESRRRERHENVNQTAVFKHRRIGNVISHSCCTGRTLAFVHLVGGSS